MCGKNKENSHETTSCGGSRGDVGDPGEMSGIDFSDEFFIQIASVGTKNRLCPFSLVSCGANCSLISESNA